MGTNYAKHVGSRATPQSQKIEGTNQVKNSAGGFSWQVDCWTRLERFLILGNEKGSYYASEKKMTQQAAAAVRECYIQHPQKTVLKIAEISDSGRAPKNDPAIFALAMLSRDDVALKAVPVVCRTATHLFQFVEAAKQFRGWGRGLRRAVADWYTSKDDNALAYQITKYQNRNGWSHHDLLHMCHPKPKTEGQSTCFRWAKTGEVMEGSPAILEAVNEAATCDEDRLCYLIHRHRLTREMLPTEKLDSVAVWDALLENMPATAMIRNLGKMTSIGLLKPLSVASNAVINRLGDEDVLKKARIHPLAVLLALSVYRKGCGVRGGLRWAPDARIVDALDAAFDKTFASVEPTGKRYLLGLDVSGSMGGAYIAGTHLSAREASAAMALVTVRTEPSTHAVGFTGGYGAVGSRRSALTELAFSKRMSLGDAVAKVSNLPFGGTDCALPMLYAIEKGLEVDVFVVYTDSETWMGSIHPSQALKKYREKTGIPAKLIVCGMTANEFTIADPQDRGMLDVVGFDASVPQVMSNFAME